MGATCTTPSARFDLMPSSKFREQQKLWSCKISSFLYLPITSFRWRANAFVRGNISNGVNNSNRQVKQNTVTLHFREFSMYVLITMITESAMNNETNFRMALNVQQLVRDLIKNITLKLK
jgi:hypothetical protein